METHIHPDDPNAKDLRPGARGKPRGEFLSQTKDLTSPTKLPLLKRLAKRELLPLYPLFFGVATAVSLAAWSVHRNLLKHPEISMRLNKGRRSTEVPEIESPEMMADKGKQYLDKTMIRDTIRRPVFEPVFRFMTIPGRSKGDEALHAQAKEKAGKMVLEAPKGRTQT